MRAMSHPEDTHPVPFVHDDLDTRSLHFGVLEIQSRMRLQDPDALDLDYTRTMMGFLALQPQARDIALIGLGGGSIAKFCHRHLRRVRLLVVEINPHVIALREQFMIPPDDERLRVLQADGTQFVAGTDERFDVLLLDAFDPIGLPAALGTQRFYDDCADVLRPGGLLVANLHSGDPQSALYAERIGTAFDGASLKVAERDGTNSVVFARKGGPLCRDGVLRVRQPAALGDGAWRQIEPAFSRLAQAWQNAGVQP